MELLDQSLIVIETGHYYRRPAAQLDHLPPAPAKDASPEAWREYHQALYEAGLLTPSGPGE